jgi:lysozyme
VTPDQRALITADLQRDEGLKLKPYQDTRGKWTIGYGHNLTDDGLTLSQVTAIFNDDLDEAIADADRTFTWLPLVDTAIVTVVYELTFNMGVGELQTFRKMLAAMEAGDRQTAANELESSDWYTQVGTRGPRLVALLRG